MPTTANAEIEDLLRELVGAYVAHPEALQLKYQETDDGNSCYWRLQGHREDDPTLVGTQGTHVKPLALLITEFGLARGMSYTFRLFTDPEKFVAKPTKLKDAMEHNTGPSHELLRRVLQALGLSNFDVTVGSGQGARWALRFQFTITVASEEDYRKLTVPRDNIEGGETIVGALGTIWRTIAKRHGVRYAIAVERKP